MRSSILVAALALGHAIGMIQPPFHPNRSSIIDSRACRPGFSNYDFCNTKLTPAQRAQAAIKEMPTDIKPKLLTARGWPQGNIQGVEEVGIPPLDKGQNSLHGVQTLCIDDRCATSFPMPNALGATFNQSLWLAMGDVIGLETRIAFLTGCPEASTWSGRPPSGLDTWSPTINQPRDPRWGRSQEVVSEDPLLLADYAVAYTKGVQEGEDPRFLRAVSTLKHWVAYSLEDSDGHTRHNFCAEVTDYDLGATYFPMFKKAVQEAKAASVMSSYNAVRFLDSANHTCTPTSASADLRHVLRDEWGFEGYQTSDTGAIDDIYANHHYVPDAKTTCCVAVKDGQCDIDSGSVYWDNLADAVAAGECSQTDVDLALQHTFEVRVRLGLFDPIEDQPYWNYSTQEFGRNSSQQLALEASRQSAVLLKNNDGLLPLKGGSNIAVIGPNADSSGALVASYLGQLCPGNKWDDLSCLQTVQAAVTQANAAKGGSTKYVKGCDINSSDKSGFSAAVSAAKTADVAVLVMGIDQSIEGESHDRSNIELPGVQHDLVQAVLAVQPKTVVVFLNGGVVDISAEKASVPAILEAFYPGYHGARALADVLFGDYAPSGRLPFTVYHSNYTNEVNMSSMCMGCAPGRTYRYFDGPVVYPFGAGLSYTTFHMDWNPQPPSQLRLPAAVPSENTAEAPSTAYTVKVTNTGAVDSDVSVLALWKPVSIEGEVFEAYPLKLELFAYQKVHVASKATVDVHFNVDQTSLRVVHPKTGDVTSAPGQYELVFTTNTMAVAEMAGEHAAAEQLIEGQNQVLRSQITVEGASPVVVERFPMPRPGRE